ncbi:hypothetical protein BWQ96_04025 [Gracilariopsis chorda]|uniref:MYND-type domain-containing protein n=1 Tax=Gracilariopsis chorda TaxID=448386 RepID=A0A2V3IYM9_9FLOR|nr:hypothetical protein BWQ96_04025 [Gracilariopsis chorda]|eukprot:PXF46240.1 hypothetical protein BWQ96_04025 [Gracilariopsis chorda]
MDRCVHEKVKDIHLQALLDLQRPVVFSPLHPKEIEPLLTEAHEAVSTLLPEPKPGRAACFVRLGVCHKRITDHEDLKLVRRKLCCKTCNQEAKETQLLICGRCASVMYCNEECQKRDFKNHRDQCVRIGALKEQLKALSNQIENYQVPNKDTVVNLFTYPAGRFWTLPGTRMYCTVRSCLADELASLGERYEVAWIAKRELKHRLELLRLSSDDALQQRAMVPFILIRLDRLEDCFAFLKHWLCRVCYQRNVNRIHKKSKQGQWIYGSIRRDEMMLDLLQMIPKASEVIDLAHLAALCLLKLRIMAKVRVHDYVFAVFARTRTGIKLGKVLQTIRYFYNREAYQTSVKRQHNYVQEYMTLLMQKNASLLPAILYPVPMLRQGRPRKIERGKPSEAWDTFRKCWRLFRRTPGTLKMLRDMFRCDVPVYDCYVES